MIGAEVQFDVAPGSHRRGGTSLRLGSFALPVRRVAAISFLGALPALLAVGLMAVSLQKSTFLYDYHGDLFTAGRAITAGVNPYPAHLLAEKASLKRAGRAPSSRFAMPVYPAPALVGTVPLSLLPYRASALLFWLASIGALILTFRLLELRDWRCVGAAALSYPVLHGLTVGAIDPFLMLGMATAWRWRDRLWRPACAVAFVVVAKVFAWPLAAWLVITRRWRTLAVSALLAAGATLGAWALIGFSGFGTYPQMLNDLAYLEENAGISLASALHAAGLGTTVAHAVVAAAVAALLGGAWHVARRPDQERRAFALVILAALTASPIVWTQYLALLFVPIALISPSLSLLWFVPLITWIAPFAQQDGHLGQIAPYLAVEFIVLASLLSPRAPRVTGATPTLRALIRAST